MMDHDDLIKNAVYKVIERIGEDRIITGFGGGNGRTILDDLTGTCLAEAASIDGNDLKKRIVVGTVLLHYLCSTLLIPTQRKVDVDGIQLDMVVPDTRTLRTDWNSCLILCILESVDNRYVAERISDAKRLQPNEANIWVVSPAEIDLGFRTFVIPGSFSDIIDEMNAFSEKSRSSRFKIFKAV